MNERFLISLRKATRRVKFTALDRELGVTIDEEQDAWPRGLVLEFDAQYPGTATLLRWIREAKGWHPYEFGLNVSLEDGNLVRTGVDEHSLPAGGYWVRPRIDDLQIRGGKQRFTLPENEDHTVRAEVDPDPRFVTLVKESDWDPTIRDLLKRDTQTIDGQAPTQWLKSTARENRKACLLNLLAKLRSTPKDDSVSFLTHVSRVFLTDVDRIYVEVDRAVHERLEALAEDTTKPFYREGAPNSPVHARLLKRVQLLGVDTTDYALESFRQEGKNSMQVVVAVPPATTGRYFADVDIDLGNPLQDAQGFLVHMGELASGRRTDHMALFASLQKGDGAERFLCYTVQK